MIDIHTHCLPSMDDGAKNIEEALAMLSDAYEGGTTFLYATPHFRAYSEEEFSYILEKREKVYSQLMEEKEKKGILTPEIGLGFEVYMDSDITDFEGYEKLCLEDTNFMLCEMPMCYWDSFTIGRLEALIERGITPIIAHVERYRGLKANIERLSYLEGIVYQVNAESFLHFWDFRFIKMLFENNLPLLVGSDMHGINERKNKIPEAYAKAIKKNPGFYKVFNTLPKELLI